ncbi:MAG: hypothetical protein AB1689_22340 [Thermodesulfobacteriota bacterium]
MIDEYFGGQEPAALDPVFSSLVSLLTRRTSASPAVFETALLLAANNCAR